MPGTAMAAYGSLQQLAAASWALVSFGMQRWSATTFVVLPGILKLYCCTSCMVNYTARSTDRRSAGLRAPSASWGASPPAAKALHRRNRRSTRRISHLEGLLGVRLFDRTTRSVGLTLLGGCFLGEMRGLVEDLDLARCSVSGRRRSRGRRRDHRLRVLGGATIPAAGDPGVPREASARAGVASSKKAPTRSWRASSTARPTWR